jgi:ribonuclease HII
MLDKPIPGLKDSKLLSRSQRSKFDELIRAQTSAVSLGWVSAAEIDQLGLSRAVSLAMERAVSKLLVRGYDEIIIDGNINYLPKYKNVRTLVGADNLIESVSAASIIAKHARDNWMINVAEVKFPGYGFGKHVGYGTAEHRRALLQNGICDLHRKSFKPVSMMIV